jgi:uncharacterized protein
MTNLQELLPPKQIDAFCRRWQIVELAVFGSVLREDFRPESDIDVLVTFEPGVRWGLLDMVEAERHLEQLLGRPVDLLNRRAVEQSENWVRRRSILNSARTIYAR